LSRDCDVFTARHLISASSVALFTRRSLVTFVCIAGFHSRLFELTPQLSPDFPFSTVEVPVSPFVHLFPQLSFDYPGGYGFRRTVLLRGHALGVLALLDNDRSLFAPGFFWRAPFTPSESPYTEFARVSPLSFFSLPRVGAYFSSKSGTVPDPAYSDVQRVTLPGFFPSGQA